MDLLNNNGNNKQKKTKKQKIVLILLIISIILFIITMALIALIPKLNNITNKVITINNQTIQTPEEFIITSSNGENYVDLKELAHLLDYEYLNGTYWEFSEDKTKGYIDNTNEIIGFEKDSNKIYKTKAEETSEYQYYEITSNIISYNNKLYIKMEDLPVALNIVAGNGIIRTPEYLAELYKTSVEREGYTIDTSYNNLKTIAYNMFVVSKDSRKGIISSNLEEIIGIKYSTINFNEYAQEFIVSSNNKYGIIKTNGETKVKLIYDALEIINYDPLIYAVKKDDKYGILDQKGVIIANTEYDSIGYNANKQSGIENTLIVPSVNETTGDGIIVKKDQKYGLIDITNGQILLECNLEGIYRVNKDEQSYYMVKMSGQEYNLADYFEYARKDT